MRILSNFIACVALAGVAILSVLLALTLCCMGTAALHRLLVDLLPVLVALLLAGVGGCVGLLGVSAVAWFVAAPLFRKVSSVIDSSVKSL